MNACKDLVNMSELSSLPFFPMKYFSIKMQQSNKDLSMRQKPKKILVSYLWTTTASSNIDNVNNCYKNMKVKK
jgi:hypothetical protein